MTITLQVGHTYLDRNGDEHGPMQPFHHDVYKWHSPTEENSTWRDDGRWLDDSGHPLDLIAEVLSAAPGPVRQRTVTEIVPGDYERLRVDRGGTEGEVWISVIPRNPLVSATMVAMNAEELRALAATATQLADALDIIASESRS